jgi:hypothetical protein
MRRLLIVSLIFICYACGITRGVYTIDGDLSDWGVTLYTDWVPNGTADYEQTDNINKYNAKGFSEMYDFEAMYFDCDPENLYFAVVSSYPLGNCKSIAGDLGFDLDGDFIIATNGAVYGLEFGVVLQGKNKGYIYNDAVWLGTRKDGHGSYGPHNQGSPSRIISGTYIGMADWAIQYYFDVETNPYQGNYYYDNAYVVEVAVSRALLPEIQCGDLISSHMSLLCGNDSINLRGDCVCIPAPGAFALCLIGAGLVNRFRLQRNEQKNS